MNLRIQKTLLAISQLLEEAAPIGGNFILLLGPPASGKGYIADKHLDAYGIKQLLPAPLSASNPVTREGDAELRRFQRYYSIVDFNDLYKAYLQGEQVFNKTLISKFYITRSKQKIALRTFITKDIFAGKVLHESSPENKRAKQAYLQRQYANIDLSASVAKPLNADAYARFFKIAGDYYASMRSSGEEGAHGEESLKTAAQKTFFQAVSKEIRTAANRGGGGYMTTDLILIDSPGEDVHKVHEYLTYFKMAKTAGFATTVITLVPGVTEEIALYASKMANFSRGLVRNNRMVDPKADIDNYFRNVSASLAKLRGSPFLDCEITVVNTKMTKSTIDTARKLIRTALTSVNRPDLQGEDNELFSQLSANILGRNKDKDEVKELITFLEEHPVFDGYSARKRLL